MQVERLCSFPSIAIDIFLYQISPATFNTLSGVVFFFWLKQHPKRCYFKKIIIIFVPEKVLNMDNLPLNEYVKSKRKALGISREEFAQKAGVGLRFLRELEQGKETLKMDKVNQVLKLFGVQLGVVPMDRNNLIE